MRKFAVGLLVYAVATTTALDAQSRLPSRLSDADFWFLSQTLSEPGGIFQSENYISNEQEMQFVIPAFATISAPARNVYVGVGPEQNYTYIAALRPQIAFIVDIRRGNTLQHLLYKALFELADDRADFLSRLLSRQRPQNLDDDADIGVISDVFAELEPDTALFRRNRTAVLDALVRKHEFPLTFADSLQITTIYQNFMRAGLEITYSYPRPNTRKDATLYDILVARDSSGVRRGFLASDSAFRFVKEMHARNLIVPVVGDFAGPKALREVGKWLRDRNAAVGVFYLSNVEQYLFQNDRWRLFYDNVGTMPIDSTSLFVRSFANMPSYTMALRAPVIASMRDVIDGSRVQQLNALPRVRMESRPGFRSATSSIYQTLWAIPNGRLMEYTDLMRLSR